MRKNIKNFVILITILSVVTVLSSCNSNNQQIKNAHSEYLDETSQFSQVEISDIDAGVSIKNDNLIVTSDIGGGTITTRKYRVNYYDVPYQFILLVGEDEYWNWEEQYLVKDPDETNIMVMKKFVENFQISREDFDKANLEWAKVIFEKMGGKPIMNPKDFANQETDEVYNADIIYTFDDEIINEYYLSYDYPFIFEHEYEEAVANGTYETRTTDWVDIEQMEAEIIAKYGEAEIVTTVTAETSAPAESTEAVDIPAETAASAESAENFTDNFTDTH